MDRKILFAVGRCRFLKMPEKMLLADCIREEHQFLALTKPRLEVLIGRKIQVKSWNASDTLRAGESDCRYIEKNDITPLFPWEAAYPPQLNEIFDPPFLLFYRGTPLDHEKPVLGAVGTRRPTGRAMRAAYSCGLVLGLNGICTVSGLARGIDRAVHRGSLDGKGGTVAVLGSGIDGIYPREHKRLAEEILENGGAVISEYPPETPPLRYNFPERNRIISGMSRAVIVVQAPEKSGALITAEYALDQGRELVVHRDGLEGRSGKGGRDLAEYGARIISSPYDLLYEWGYARQKRDTCPRRVYGGNGTRADEKPVGKVLSEGLERELAGTAVTRFGSYWELA